MRERGLPQMSFPAALGLAVPRGPAQRRRRRHARQDDHLGADGARARRGGHGPDVPRRRRDAELRRQLPRRQGAALRRRGRRVRHGLLRQGPQVPALPPRTAILTSVEFDHADIYRDLAHYESAFDEVRRDRFPPDGTARRLRDVSRTRVAHRARALPRRRSSRTRATRRRATTPREDVRFGPEGARFEIVRRRRVASTTVLLPMSGHHNVENALGVYAAARALGLIADAGRAGLRHVQGREAPAGGARRDRRRARDRRLRAPPDRGARDDRGDRQRYPDRRARGPCSSRAPTRAAATSTRAYANALRDAARVFIKVPEPHDKVPVDEQLDVNQIVSDLARRGRHRARDRTDVDELVRMVATEAQAGRRGARDEQRRVRRIRPEAARSAVVLTRGSAEPGSFAGESNPVRATGLHSHRCLPYSH